MTRDEYAVRLIDLPEAVGGFVTESPDGFVNIYINARYSRAGQREALRHELRHAESDDLHSAEPVAVIEARADGVPEPLKEIPNLIRARDLLPPEPEPEPEPEPPRRELTPHQARVLMSAISALDDFAFGGNRIEWDY